MTTSPTTQQGTIQGEVTYREGDGMPIAIPHGPVELTHSHDSVTLSWTADNNAAGVAAIPRDEFDRFVREGQIHVEGGPAPVPEPPQAEATAAGGAQPQQQTQDRNQNQEQKQNPQQQQASDTGRPVPDAETSQDGHAVEHEYAEAAQANADDSQPRTPVA